MNTWQKRAASLMLVVLMLLLLIPGSLAEEGSTVSNPVIPGLADGGTLLNAISDVALLAISGSSTVQVGGTTTLTGSNSQQHSWSSSDSSIATVSWNSWYGYQATVTGVSEGTVTITHTYSSRGSTVTERYEVTVVARGNEGAQVYFLKTPASDPDSNATDQWSSNVGDATVNTTGATWTNDKNAFKSNNNLSAYIISWPDGSTGSTWTLDKNTYASQYQEVYNAYKEELEKKLGITDLKLEDIEEITLIPYKISKGNGTNPDKHIDCTISVKCSKAYVARFNVQYPGDVDYTNVSAENKKIIDGTAEAINEYTDANKVPAEKVVNGVTYVFDGWYNEGGEKIKLEQWPYKPNADELEDGTVYFYAHYVPARTDVTINKLVTGNMGDKNKAFSFTVNSDQAMGTGNGYDLSEDEKTATFNLTHGNSVTLKNVPIGAKLTISESGADDYTITVQNSNGTQINGTYSVVQSENEITVINTKSVTIDTGVSLDILPYILLLAVVGGAVTLLVVMSRKRRKED